MFSNRKFAALFALICAIVLVEFLQCASAHANDHDGAAVKKHDAKKDAHHAASHRNKPGAGHPAAHGEKPKSAKKEKTKKEKKPKKDAAHAKAGKSKKPAKSANKAGKKDKQAKQNEYMQKKLHELLTKNHFDGGKLATTLETTIIKQFHEHVKNDAKHNEAAKGAQKVSEAYLKKMLHKEAEKASKGKHEGGKPKPTAGHAGHESKDHKKPAPVAVKTANAHDAEKDKKKHNKAGAKGNKAANGNGKSHSAGGNVPKKPNSGSRSLSPSKLTKEAHKDIVLSPGLKEQAAAPAGHQQHQNVSAQQHDEDFEEFRNSGKGMYPDNSIGDGEPNVKQFDGADEEQQNGPSFNVDSDDDFPPLSSKLPTRGNRSEENLGGVEGGMQQSEEESARPSEAEPTGDAEEETFKQSADPMGSDEEKMVGGEGDEMNAPREMDGAEEETAQSEANVDEEDGEGGELRQNADYEPKQHDEEENGKADDKAMDDDDGGLGSMGPGGKANANKVDDD